VHTSEGTAWVFLVRRSVCVAQGHLGGIACDPASRAAAEGVTLGVFSAPTKRRRKPHDFRLIGLAPDGVSHISVTVGTHRQTIIVRDNVFVASAEKPIVIRQMRADHS